MNNLKKRLQVEVALLRYVHKCLKILSKGQSEKFEIMMLAHRLEKGLVNTTPKPQWGWLKAKRLGWLLNRNKQAVSYQTGLAVLYQYLNTKKKDPAERALVENFIKEYQLEAPIVNGGTIRLLKGEISNLNIADIEKLFLTRHSTRDFANTPIDKGALEKAILLLCDARVLAIGSRIEYIIWMRSNVSKVLARKINQRHLFTSQE